jgi:mannose-6-phosphate isomerase-like protein (cupin superfamily)
MSEATTAKPSKAAIDPEELLQLQLAAEEIVTPFSYHKPQDGMGKRASVNLCKTDLYRASVVVMKQGTGETNLHYHTGADSFWMVLKGRVRFYGPDDVLIGEFGPNEGTSTPRFSRYWFENVGEEDLEMLHVFANITPGDHKSGRTDSVPRPDYMPPIGSQTTRFDAAKS